MAFSNPFTTSAWPSSSNFEEFRSCRNHRKLCSIAGVHLIQTFSPDFLCYEKIIVEIKAVSALVDEHRAQVLNYLSATDCKLGLLVNFGHYPRLEYERLLPRTPSACRSSALKIFASFVYFVGKEIFKTDHHT